MICQLKNPMNARPLFGDWPETILWSCLEGTMGHIYGDTQEKPTCVMAILGDFCFLAGEPSAELVSFKPDGMESDYIIMTPQNDSWAEVIRVCYGEKARPTVRYAIKKEPDAFNRETLERFAASIPEDVQLTFIGEKEYHQCRLEDWSRDFVSQFPTYEEFTRLGLGVVAVKDGKIIAGASSYSRYSGGIEVEIDTKKEYRRRGLGTACGAAFVLACLDRGLYPSWDAHNLWSVWLAEKLGYHFSHEYPVFEITGY